jgi:hypothetical protein
LLLHPDFLFIWIITQLPLFKQLVTFAAVLLCKGDRKVYYCQPYRRGKITALCESTYVKGTFGDAAAGANLALVTDFTAPDEVNDFGGGA